MCWNQSSGMDKRWIVVVESIAELDCELQDVEKWVESAL